MSNTKDNEPGTENRSRSVTWVMRFMLFMAAICLCSAAAFLAADQWRSSRLGRDLSLETGDSNLNFIERTYLGVRLANRSQDLENPVGTGAETISFEVSSGESADQIATNLSEAGLLSDRDLFLSYVRYYGLDSRLEAGTYRLNPQMTYPELAKKLTKFQIEEIELRFLEGWRQEEMAAYLKVVNPADISSTEFESLVISKALPGIEQYAFLSSLPEGASLEGFLFPDSYVVSVSATAQDLLTMMLDNFNEKLTPSIRQSIGAQGLNIYEALILASIVEREAVVDAEKPAIASVFINRYRDGMPLQADPTVQYALGYDSDLGSWWKSPLSSSDLEINSPYNTYIVTGLPAGPIANPGLDSIQAVAMPKDTDYYYFVSDCSPELSGTHIFSTTFEEHLANVERCR